jgi:drug/metabolite transporter (DMT)-like permease
MAVQDSRITFGLMLTFATALAYGAWPSAMRAVYADGGNASFVILLATILRALPLLITCLIQRRPLFQTKQDRRNALTGGFFQSISSSSALAAVLFLPGPLAVVIMFSHTLMLLFYMIWRKEAKAEASTLVTTTAALLGLCLVLDLFHKQSSATMSGIALAFISAIAVASRLYVYGHQTKTRPPAVVGAENFLVALAFMPLILFYQIPSAPHSLAGWGWMALGSLSLALGTLGQFYAISLLGSFRYSLFMKMEPLFATIFAALLIGEYLKLSQYLGIVMVTGSLALYQFMEHRKRRKDDKMMMSSGGD